MIENMKYIRKEKTSMRLAHLYCSFQQKVISVQDVKINQNSLQKPHHCMRQHEVNIIQFKNAY